LGAVGINLKLICENNRNSPQNGGEKGVPGLLYMQFSFVICKEGIYIIIMDNLADRIQLRRATGVY
jgi:hypothetical protein